MVRPTLVQLRLRELPLSCGAAFGAYSLPEPFHRDPADRIWSPRRGSWARRADLRPQILAYAPPGTSGDRLLIGVRAARLRPREARAERAADRRSRTSSAPGRGTVGRRAVLQPERVEKPRAKAPRRKARRWRRCRGAGWACARPPWQGPRGWRRLTAMACGEVLLAISTSIRRLSRARSSPTSRSASAAEARPASTPMPRRCSRSMTAGAPGSERLTEACRAARASRPCGRAAGRRRARSTRRCRCRPGVPGTTARTAAMVASTSAGARLSRPRRRGRAGGSRPHRPHHRQRRRRRGPPP